MPHYDDMDQLLASISPDTRARNGLDAPKQGKATQDTAQAVSAPQRASEHQEQAALFARIDAHMAHLPILRLVYAIPNGGQRHVAVAAKLKAEGVRAGVLDIHAPWASQGHIGLWIEMKVGKNKPTEAQERWIADLRAAGHRVEVCYSADVAWGILLSYALEARHA